MAMFFSDQYVQLKGENVLVPPHVVKANKNFSVQVKDEKLYINGYKYDSHTKKWQKSIYGKWLMFDLYSQVQILSGIGFLMFTIFIILLKGYLL